MSLAGGTRAVQWAEAGIPSPAYVWEAGEEYSFFSKHCQPSKRRIYVEMRLCIIMPMDPRYRVSDVFPDVTPPTVTNSGCLKIEI